jgi:predicted DCC family thiol-disulfide oxidoreductase YuxK
MIEIKKDKLLNEGISTKLIGKIPEGKSLILFDGDCLLCSRLIRFLLCIDKEKILLFTTFGSSFAGLQKDTTEIPQSLIFINHTGIYTGSEAVMETAKSIRRLSFIAVILRVVPFSVRETAYRWIARHRYRIFGRADHCFIPPAGDAGRFLK